MHIRRLVTIYPIYDEDNRFAGMHVHIGCQKFFYTYFDSFMSELRYFLNSPDRVECIYNTRPENLKSSVEVAHIEPAPNAPLGTLVRENQELARDMNEASGMPGTDQEPGTQTRS